MIWVSCLSQSSGFQIDNLKSKIFKPISLWGVGKSKIVNLKSKIKGRMGRAGKALKQVLETYNISQNQLAVTMGIRRSNVSRWVSEIRDPVAETMLEIRNGLRKIHPAAAEDFIRLYIGDSPEDEEQAEGNS